MRPKCRRHVGAMIHAALRLRIKKGRNTGRGSGRESPGPWGSKGRGEVSPWSKPAYETPVEGSKGRGMPFGPGCRGRDTPLPQVQTAQVWSLGTQARAHPRIGHWGSGETRNLPGRAAPAKRCAAAMRARCPPASLPCNEAMAAPIPWRKCIPSCAASPRDSLGVPTGDGKSPCKVRVVVPRTPCIRLNPNFTS